MSRATVSGVCLVALASFWIARPVLLWDDGTARDISVEVLQEPFIGSDKLVYRWRGDVYRSCPVEIRRQFIDSDNVVTNLTALSWGRLPLDDLGPQEYEITVQAPRNMAEGPAVYQATEVPQCDWLQSLSPPAIEYPAVEFTVTR